MLITICTTIEINQYILDRDNNVRNVSNLKIIELIAGKPITVVCTCFFATFFHTYFLANYRFPFSQIFAIIYYHQLFSLRGTSFGTNEFRLPISDTHIRFPNEITCECAHVYARAYIVNCYYRLPINSNYKFFSTKDVSFRRFCVSPYVYIEKERERLALILRAP